MSYEDVIQRLHNSQKLGNDGAHQANHRTLSEDRICDGLRDLGLTRDRAMAIVHIDAGRGSVWAHSCKRIEATLAQELQQASSDMAARLKAAGIDDGK